MNYLLYCILPTPVRPWPRKLSGLAGRPVFLLGENGLSAAVSGVESCSAPEVSGLLRYQEVIARIGRRCAVIPLRYGSVCANPFQVTALLRKRSKHYRALLNRLAGMAEMGIRILLEDAGPEPPAIGRSGAAYLDRLASRARLSAEREKQAEEIHGSFVGLFNQSKKEFRFAGGRPVVSLHFLVPKKNLTPFRRVFRGVTGKTPATLLLSGPWPPFNFV